MDFFIIDQFRSSGQADLINKALGIKGINTKFSYSHVVENLASVFVSGGEVLEDVNFFRDEWQKTEINNQDFSFTGNTSARPYATRRRQKRVFAEIRKPETKKKDEDSSSPLII